MEKGGLGTFKGEISSNLISGLKMPSLRLVINGAIKTKMSFPLPIMTEGLRATYEIVGRKIRRQRLNPAKSQSMDNVKKYRKFYMEKLRRKSRKAWHGETD